MSRKEPTGSRDAARLAVAVTVAATCLPGGLAGQEGGPPGTSGGEEVTVWFPDATAFAPLLAAPREVSLRGSFVVSRRDGGPAGGADFAGGNVEAEVALGHRLAVARFRSDSREGPALALGFEVGVFARFFMETAEKDLIGADFRVGAPLSLREGPWEARLTLLHVSSHLGDDFLLRFGARRQQVTRDGVEILAARRLPGGFRAYAGGGWNFHVNPGVERTAGQVGMEWEPRARAAAAAAQPGGPAVWPFAAVDLAVTSRARGVATTAVAGLALRVGGSLVRLEARGHSGPSIMGQFRGRDEEFLGLGLRVQP